MKSKLTFVLWSGGLDSTYMIQKLLDGDKEKKVVSGYVEVLNNHDKTKAEQRARDAMIPIFNKKYGDRFFDFGTIHKAMFCVHNHWSPLVQMPIWFNALIGSVPYDVGEICIGYVMNDCAISYLNDLQALAKCFSKRISKKPFPPIRFPLSKDLKEEIAYNIDSELKPHVVWCEMPIIVYEKEPEHKEGFVYDGPKIESITPCGNCIPCKHSPIWQDSKPIACEKQFVESFNVSEPNQKEFDFVINSTKEQVYEKIASQFASQPIQAKSCV